MKTVIDTSRLRREIGSSMTFAKWLGWKMEPVLKEAQNTAPDAPPIGKGYKEQLGLWYGIPDSGQAVARVTGHHFNSGWVEFGAHAGGKTRVLRYRILGRALRSVRRT